MVADIARGGGDAAAARSGVAVVGGENVGKVDLVAVANSSSSLGGIVSSVTPTEGVATSVSEPFDSSLMWPNPFEERPTLSSSEVI